MSSLPSPVILALPGPPYPPRRSRQPPRPLFSYLLKPCLVFLVSSHPSILFSVLAVLAFFGGLVIVNIVHCCDRCLAIRLALCVASCLALPGTFPCLATSLSFALPSFWGPQEDWVFFGARSPRQFVQYFFALSCAFSCLPKACPVLLCLALSCSASC